MCPQKLKWLAQLQSAKKTFRYGLAETSSLLQKSTQNFWAVLTVYKLPATVIKILMYIFQFFLSGLAVGPRTQLFYSWPSRLLTNRPPRRKNVAMARWQHWTREIRGKFTLRFWAIARSVRIIDFQGSCDGRVVKALDLKSNGIFPHRFEPCSQR